LALVVSSVEPSAAVAASGLLALALEALFVALEVAEELALASRLPACFALVDVASVESLLPYLALVVSSVEPSAAVAALVLVALELEAFFVVLEVAEVLESGLRACFVPVDVASVGSLLPYLELVVSSVEPSVVAFVAAALVFAAEELDQILVDYFLAL
jgi:hypothetical protein